MNYPEHTCRSVDEMGDPYPPRVATCGACGRSWCEACAPTPAALCPFCCASGSDAPIPPRQVRRLEREGNERRRGVRPRLDPWQVRPH